VGAATIAPERQNVRSLSVIALLNTASLSGPSN